MDCSEFNGRYDDILEELLRDLGATELLRIDTDHGYQGHTDVDVLLSDGRVFSYKYWYGSCSACDEWDFYNLSIAQIKHEMKRGATFFDNIEDYKSWRGMVAKNEV